MKIRQSSFVLAAAAMFLATTAIADNPPAGAADTQPTLSSPEMLSQAQNLQKEMQTYVARIVVLQDQAKKSKDIIKLNSVSDKLIQVRGNIAVADKAMVALSDAVAKGDYETAKNEFSKIQILYQKVLVLTTEAENAVGGDDLSYLGATSVTQEVDPNITTADPTQPSNLVLGGVGSLLSITERPPLSSEK